MTTTKFYWPFHLATFVFGLLVAFSLLNGDAEGRVNLLYLLLLYFLIPVIGALVSLYALVFGSKNHIAQWLVQVGLFKLNQQAFFQHLRHLNQDRNWLLQQSQIMAMMFAFASIVTLFIVLLFSDIAFVWRSTLLTHEHVYSLLKIIASPWFFWAEAQPDLNLLRETQDFRLSNSALNPQQAGQWWLFILTTQLFYSIILRGVIYGLLQLRLGSANDSDDTNEIEQDDSEQEELLTLPSPGNLKDYDDYSEVIFWHVIPEEIIVDVFGIDKATALNTEAWDGSDLQSKNFKDSEKPLVIVKGWEPPMAELADVIADKIGYLLILNWRNGASEPVTPIQQDEWARFCKAHKWQLLITGDVDHG